jgi:hypothetical protein
MTSSFEALLVQAIAGLARGVSAQVRRRDEPARLHVLHRQAGVERDHPRRRVVGGHERRSDDPVLPGRERAKVDDRRLHLVRRPQRAVVGLVDRAGAVGVGERAAGGVERVRVGSLNEVVSVSAAGPRWALERWMPFWNEPKLIRCPPNWKPSRSRSSGTRSS